MAQEPLGNILRQEPALTALQEASIMPPSVSKLIESIYGPEINHLEGISPEIQEDAQKATTILKGFYTHALDSGLKRKSDYTTPANEVLSVNSVAMLRRSAFTDYIKNLIISSGNKPIAFLFLDVVNLRGADLAGSANYVLGSVAETIQKSINDTRYQSNTQSCRYAGDEFVVSAAGNNAYAQIESLRDSLHASIKQLSGYYREYERDPKTLARINEQTLLENVDIKPKIIKIPTDPYGKTIFLSHLKFGLLIDENDIEKIKQKFPNEQDYICYMKDIEPQSIYPKDANTLIEKITYLKNKHPELNLALSLAESLDDLTGTDKRKQAILNFLETVVYDSLLGEAYYSFTDFQEHLSQGQFSTVYGFDMKYIKEINDNFGYIEGDMAIRILSNQIKDAISDKDKNKVFLSRRGGTFMIGVRKGEVLTDETLAKLKEINNAGLITDSKNPENMIHVPIGEAIVNVDEATLNTKSDRFAQAGKIIGQALQEADRNWYLSLFDQIAASSSFEKASVSYDMKLSGFDPDTQKNVILTELFFSGKRRDDRLDRALEILNPLLQSNHDVFSAVYDYLFRIYKNK